MTPHEARYAVWLYRTRVGTLYQRGDYTRFVFTEDYLDDPYRPVLGMVFEQNLMARHAAALRLPCWFSNLLPEGRLREWIAADRNVSPQREMELLAQVGHDLPGAVRIMLAEDDSEELDWSSELPAVSSDGVDVETAAWRFSLAGVALKFSMLAKGDRLTLPAYGAGGDWIVKLPDQMYANVPNNEFAMMSLAASANIDVPEIRLVHRDEIDGLPPGVWPGQEEWAYAVRRFDRSVHRVPVHIEDLAQVRNVYPNDKYTGNYETVAALVYRGRDISALQDFARRLAFAILVSNGDAHLKNWSLIYPDRRIPKLAPAYDLVCTAFYMGDGEQLGLKFGGTRRFDRIGLGTFGRLERRLRAQGAGLVECVGDLIEKVGEYWPEHQEKLAVNPALLAYVQDSIVARSRSLLGTQES